MATLLHAPKNTIRRIDNVWMVVSVDPNDNTEGVCAAPTGREALMVPLIAADEERLPWIREKAQVLANLGLKVKLIRLTTREEVEDFAPR